jgi:hypothetical protein
MTDASSRTATASFTWTVTSSGPVVTNPGNRTNSVGNSVSLKVNSTGGTTPIRWSATGLPPGLSIKKTTGKITGTVTTAGTYTVTVTATDKNGLKGTATFTWTVT